MAINQVETKVITKPKISTKTLIVIGLFFIGSIMAAVPLIVPTVTVIAPNGGETIEWNEKYQIEWNASGAKKVSISLYMNNSFVGWIAKNLSSKKGVYKWLPSKIIKKSLKANTINEISSSDTFKIKIDTRENKILLGTASDFSDASFKISERIYAVKTGNSLWKISKKFYGTGWVWPIIFAANETALKNSKMPIVGQKLIIPFISKSVIKAAARDARLISETAEFLEKNLIAKKKVTASEKVKKIAPISALTVMNYDLIYRGGGGETGLEAPTAAVSLSSVTEGGPANIGNLGQGTVAIGATAQGTPAASVTVGNVTSAITISNDMNTVTQSITNEQGITNITTSFSQNGSVSISFAGAENFSVNLTAAEVEAIDNAFMDATVQATVDGLASGMSPATSQDQTTDSALEANSDINSDIGEMATDVAEGISESMGTDTTGTDMDTGTDTGDSATGDSADSTGDSGDSGGDGGGGDW